MLYFFLKRERKIFFIWNSLSIFFNYNNLTIFKMDYLFLFIN